ncbi:single-stranded DNA-binding protein [Butyricimonas paravirosa]|uniref:single-stranded DNA-binding protein n=1 Tax=Butyricimonas paravirosa TaxID=1472417 RepID=UPI002A80E57B|nr:single-stranded DNA-binding protein [Butyricimonas paravirosa]
MVNKVILVGTVGKDPEVRNTQNNKVATFSLATNESYKDKNGEKKIVTEWHNVVIWGKLAEIVEKYVKKGNHLYLEGKLSSRSWEDQNGTKRYITEVIVHSMTMLPSARKSGEDRQGSSQETFSNNDDLPF